MAIKLEEMMNEFRYPSQITTGKNIVTTGTFASGSQTVTGSVSATGSLTGSSAGSNTSGGNTTAGVIMGASMIGIYYGSGTPTISATQGSLYVNVAGSGTANRVYVGGGGTSWIAITTAS